MEVALEGGLDEVGRAAAEHSADVLDGLLNVRLIEEGGECAERDVEMPREAVEGLIGLEVTVEEVVEVDWCLSGVHGGKVQGWDGFVKGSVWGIFGGFGVGM